MVGKKRAEPTDRLTRVAASSCTMRTSYNDDIVLLKLFHETDTTRAMACPCSDFRMAADIKDEFDNLCAVAGLTHLVTRRVQQYPKLTYYFVNWFRYNDKTSMIEFRLYEDVFTMSLAEFCDVIGVRNVGKTTKLNVQPYELKSLFASLCNKDLREIHRGRSPASCFPTSGISHTILLEGCYLVTTRATFRLQISLSWQPPFWEITHIILVL